MQNFYPLYVSAALYNSSQEVGMHKLRLWDEANNAFASLEVADGIVKFRDVSENLIGSLTVREVDGVPSPSCITLVFPNGSLTDSGGGVATVDFFSAAYLQTTDPGVAGQLWNDGGIAKFSAGLAGQPFGLLLALTKAA